MAYPFFTCIAVVLITASGAQSQSQAEHVLISSITFFDKNGQQAFMGKIKVWQRGDVFLQEVYVVTTKSDARSSATTYVPMFCRQINMQSKAFHDFYSFSDTSQCFNKGKIAHITSIDGTWMFFSDYDLQFQSPPKHLTDTIIDNKTYRQVQFYRKGYGNDSTRNYSIGLFPYNKEYSILSLEKEYSRSKNWFLERILDYYYVKNGRVLNAITENKFIANSLTDHETQVFNAWEQYAREHPVK